LRLEVEAEVKVEVLKVEVPTSYTYILHPKSDIRHPTSYTYILHPKSEI
jgi:hypothetical protein